AERFGDLPRRQLIGHVAIVARTSALLAVIGPDGGAFLEEGAQAFLSLGGDSLSGGHTHDLLASRVGRAATKVADERLGGPGGRGARRQDLGNGSVEPPLQARPVR